MTAARRSDGDQWCDTLAGVLNAYPAAVRTGIAFWSELANNASRYYAETLEGLIAAWGRPAPAHRVLGDVQRGFREFLERSGETTERAVLDFNERFTATFRTPPAPAGEAEADRGLDVLRRLADQGATQSLRLHDPRTPADLGMILDQVELLLGEVRAIARGAPRPSSASPAVSAEP